MRAERPTIEMCARLARRVARNGGVWTIEHPERSLAWKEAAWVALAAQPGVRRVVLHQCRYGLRNHRTGELVRKATAILSNVPLPGLARLCNHPGGHPHLVGGADCAAAAAYPRPLCSALVRAVKPQLCG